MTLRVSGKNLSIGQALRTHVHGRMDGIIAKYNAGSPSGHVTIEPEGSGYRADCTLFLASGVTLQVEAVAPEPYASFDKAADRVERRLRDQKKRLNTRHEHDDLIAAGVTEPDPTRPDGPDHPPVASAPPQDPDDEHEVFPTVVAEHANGFAAMTVAAAVRKLDATSDAVVVFRYAEDQRINIVYRRGDGNIGWIDPLAVGRAR